VEYVLANGSIVTASSTHFPDLFWAARGAGQAFGVATNFVFQAHEQRSAVWAGILSFPPSQLSEIINASNQLVDKCTGKSSFGVAFMCPPPAFEPFVGIFVFYNGSEEEGRKFFEPWLSLEPFLDTTSTMPYEDVNGSMVRSILLIMNSKGYLLFLPSCFKLAPSFRSGNTKSMAILERCKSLWISEKYERLCTLPHDFPYLVFRPAYPFTRHPSHPSIHSKRKTSFKTSPNLRKMFLMQQVPWHFLNSLVQES
jgi:hypothetical protein